MTSPVLLILLVAATVLLVRLPGGVAMTPARAPGGSGGWPSTGRAPDLSRGWALTEALAPLADPGSPSDPGPASRAEAPVTDGDLRVAHLVEQAQAGDAQAFAELFERFQGPIYRQLYFLTRSVHVAEDLTSETFFRALRAVGRSQAPGAYFGPWLRKVARNLAYDHHTARSTKAEQSTGDFSWFEPSAPDPGMAAAIENDSLRDALGRLPESQRRVLAMRFLCQLSIEETAEQVGCTYGAAKQLQWRGLRNLERILGEQEAS